MYENMFSPINLGGVTLKNRILFTLTSLGLSEKAYEEKIRCIAAGGCAVVIIGDVPVSRHGMLSLYEKKGGNIIKGYAAWFIGKTAKSVPNCTNPTATLKLW